MRFFAFWGFIKMNILIVGNGFDLSHYLPTKYDHFMDVMGVIAEKDTGGLPKNLAEKSIDEWLNLLEKTFQKREGIASPPHDMTFDELFYKTRDSKFIEKTKEFYLTESVEICAKDVLELQYRLELNCWYQYFKNHVEEIKTWIDFEQKIEDVLKVFGRKVVEIETLDSKETIINYFNGTNDSMACISTIELKALNFFELTVKENMCRVLSRTRDGKPFQTSTGSFISLNKRFCIGDDLQNGFNPSKFLDFLNKQLEDFIKIFNFYLELVVKKLEHRTTFEILVKSNSFFEKNENDWIKPDLIYSFNYTNTYQRIYGSIGVEYLHGFHGENQNIVLGVADLKSDSLKMIKAYGFTKYHQKLFKDTDYLFLDVFKEKVKIHKRKIEYFEKDFGDNDPTAKKFERQKIMEVEGKLNLNISIWGHSLDVSDQDYILDLFSLNDDIDRNVRVTVYYFDKTAKFSLLNNLLAILSKDKVEQWMKNKWLCFKPNPEIKFLAQESSDVDQAS